MDVSARIEPIDRIIAVIYSESLSPQAQSRKLAQVARFAIDEASEHNRRVLGRIPPYKVWVDGAEGVLLERVRPDGRIVAEYEVISDVLLFISAELESVSPKFKGRYSKSHVLFADGVEIFPGSAVPDASEYVFISSVPYARKIEGANFRKPLSGQAPNGVYEITAAKARSRFGNVARIKYSFRSLVGSSMLNSWAQTTSLRPKHKIRESRIGDWLRRQPAIVVTFRN